MRPAKDTFKNLHAVIRSRHIFATGFVLASLFAIMSYALPSKAMVSSPLAPKTALIYGPSVSGGASSQEALAAITQGYTVTVVTHATWTTMTQAQFGTYDLLIIGDPTCSSSSTTAAVTNVAVWGPVVMGTAGGRTLAGNRILVGTDPVFHSGGYTTVRATIIRTGIDFAGKQPGRTGLYISTSCSHGTIGSVLAGLSLLSTGTGTWTSNPAPPCGGNVSLIAAEPSFATLTTASLQGWGCSVHNSFPTFPSDWSALAVATDTPTRPTCGVDPNTGLSACGQAYILIAGSSIVVVSGSISIDPLDATNQVGTNHTVTATLTSGGAPIVGQVVTFTVTGQNAGATGICSAAGCITDTNGQVTFTYTGTNGVGDDTIKASFTDATGSLQAATAQKHWIITDSDGDGILDDVDNCPEAPNPDQADSDGDGQGNVCDSDDDNDGITDSADNCPLTANSDQADNDADGIGDACDADDDNDGVADGTDNCQYTANPSQSDNDSDGLGDACDADDDNDGVADNLDNCPFTSNPDQTDTDLDGFGNACDADDDNDGLVDGADNCPLAANADQADLDNDGIGDACDADDDGDGVTDTADNCPRTPNADQRDTNNDGVGDACTAFEWATGGQFVIGDLVSNADGATTYFWGSQWSQNNAMTGGPAPNAFKGFENGLGLPVCGGTWTSQPGNSSSPPLTVPEFMAVIVSSSITQQGPVISGNVKRIVVVRTTPGYGPSPGHTGMGQVVAILCSVP